MILYRQSYQSYIINPKISQSLLLYPPHLLHLNPHHRGSQAPRAASMASKLQRTLRPRITWLAWAYQLGEKIQKLYSSMIQFMNIFHHMSIFSITCSYLHFHIQHPIYAPCSCSYLPAAAAVMPHFFWGFLDRLQQALHHIELLCSTTGIQDRSEGDQLTVLDSGVR